MPQSLKYSDCFPTTAFDHLTPVDQAERYRRTAQSIEDSGFPKHADVFRRIADRMESRMVTIRQLIALSEENKDVL
jgi:hypothetical protein